MGSHTLVTGTLGAHRMRVVVPAARLPLAGETIHLRPLPGRLRWMNAETGAALETP
jgi:hypothetical protein